MVEFNIWNVLKQIMKAAMLICLLFVGMMVGAMYNDYKDTNPTGTPIKFLTHSDTLTMHQGDEIPPDFLEKIALYNSTVRVIWIALFFYVLFEFISYKANPKKHWFSIIRRKNEETDYND